MSDRVIDISGELSIHSYGDDDEALFISTESEPLADVLKEINNKTVTVRYWLTDQEMNKESASMEFMKKLYGVADIDYGSVYSEYTGYLWTDENLEIGGHDLLAELTYEAGKWLNLEITVHDEI